jgi:hypothetical protein
MKDNIGENYIRNAQGEQENLAFLLGDYKDANRGSILPFPPFLIFPCAFFS